MLTLLEIQKMLNATCATKHSLDKIIVGRACASDLLSDVLLQNRENVILITGLANPQVIRTAELIGAVGVIFVRGKVPSQEIIDLAEEKNIPVLHTRYFMYKSCGLLYQAGLE